MNARLEALRQIWEGFTPREKRLAQLMGVACGLMLIALPVFLLSSSIDEVQAENERIVEILSEIDHADARIAQRDAERAAAERRYAQRAPALGSFLSARAQARGIQVGPVHDQPEVQEGHFRRRSITGNFQQVGLRDLIRFMADLEASEFPVAVQSVQITHNQAGDQYSLDLGIITYDRDRPAARDAGVPSGAAEGSGRAGPPPPP